MGSVYTYALANAELSKKVNKKKTDWSHYKDEFGEIVEDEEAPEIDALASEGAEMNRKKDRTKSALEFLSGAVNWLQTHKGSGNSGASYTPTKTPPKDKDKTLLYVGVGVGVIALGIGAYFLIKK